MNCATALMKKTRSLCVSVCSGISQWGSYRTTSQCSTDASCQTGRSVSPAPDRRSTRAIGLTSLKLGSLKLSTETSRS